MVLQLVGSDIVHLDKITFMCVQMTHFAIDVDRDDGEILASLISSPEYAHDYASPLPPESAPLGKPVHGRWVLEEINVGRFEATTADRAEAVLHRWPTSRTGQSLATGSHLT